MEEQKNNKGLIIIICVLCVLVLALGGYIVYDKINDNKETNIEREQIDDNIQTDNTTTETNNIPSLQEIYNDSDTDLVKAQKIAKEVMNAVNNKNYDFIKKNVNEGEVENIKKYDIHNYSIDLDNYRKIDEQGIYEYVFDETYSSNITEDQESEMGNMLVVSFEDGKIIVDMFCTGI